MKRITGMKKFLCVILAALTVFACFALACFAGCANDKGNDRAGEDGKLTYEDYKNAKVGVVTGSYAATFVGDLFPDAEILHYSNSADLTMALAQGKIDITPCDVSLYTTMLWEGINVARLDEPFETSNYGMIFKKGTNAELRSKVNAFIAEIKQNGVYDELNAKWFGNKEPTEYYSPDALEGPNGTLKIITDNKQKPFVYIKNGKNVGYDIDFLTLFAREYGYRLEFTCVDLGSVLQGVSSEKYDIATAGFTITEERKESVDFTDVYHVEDIVYLIRGDESNNLARFNNSDLGVVTGSLYGGYSSEQFPNARISEFNNFADVLMALKQGKVDGTMLDRPNFNSVKRSESKLSCVSVPSYSVDIGFGFQKTDGGQVLQAQMNAFIAKLRGDGRLDAMLDKWYGEKEPEESVPLEELNGNGGKKLKVSIDTTRKPFVYMYNNKPVGFEIEVLYLFCEEYDYTISYEDVSFASGLAGLAGEKYDLVCGGLYMTPERKDSVNFSEPYMQAEVVMAYYGKGAVEGFFSDLGESFEKTFIREARWKLIAEGILTTLLISLFAVLGGTLLGFALYLASRSKYKAVSNATKVFARIYSKLIAGTPTLVVLMILFYVVFGKADISGIIVAIFGFILTFGAFVYNQLALSVSAVDIGQTEAAYALGYSRNKTFFRIVLPQSLKSFVPVYSSEIISLIKATSVVGYIAVNDLTKMGDIIRSNTYEAFFPLIAVAIVYFLITWGVAAVLNLLRKKTEPKRRKDKNILKGVKR